MNTNDKIYVAGHNGLVGSSIIRRLKKGGFSNIVCRSSSELDLRKQKDVEAFFMDERPDYVFLAAAKVGGISANNSFPAQFIYDNIMIEANVIHEAYKAKVKKLIFLGSSCIYPKYAEQPMKEEYLLDGKLEPTNEPYAIAKIAGIKLCQAYNKQYGTNFISVMPTNLYGPNDNFNLNTSHVLPALTRKFHDAKINRQPEVELWGDGSPLREFLHVDDMTDACVFLMENYNGSEHINIGTGEEVSIKELADKIKNVTGYEGEIIWNSDIPNGTPRKLLDVSRLKNLGWEYKINLDEGISMTYQWFRQNIESLKL